MIKVLFFWEKGSIALYIFIRILKMRYSGGHPAFREHCDEIADLSFHLWWHYSTTKLFSSRLFDKKTGLQVIAICLK